MRNVLIVVDAVADHPQADDVSGKTDAIVSALKQAMALEPGTSEVQIQVVPVSALKPEMVGQAEESDRLICPLTLDIPAWLPFAAEGVYSHCRNVEALRQTVSQWGYAIGQGSLWLPIVWTARGPLYAEVIGLDKAPHPSPVFSYYQPIHLPDAERQPLYKLGHRLLKHLQAPAAVYLMQVAFHQGNLVFDRLIPFPAEPAIASLNVQTPDLFTCHWRCLTKKTILDLLVG
jgi:hypothetical protein